MARMSLTRAMRWSIVRTVASRRSRWCSAKPKTAPTETSRSLMGKIIRTAWECYLFLAVCGFPWIVVESWPLAVLLLLPVLVWLWRDSTPVEPEIRF